MEKIKLKKNVYISIARKTLSMIRYDLFIQATRTIKRFCWLRNSSFNERHTNWLTSLIRLLFFRFYSNISFENRFNIQIKSITRIVNEELKMDWYPGLNIYVEFPCRKNEIKFNCQIKFVRKTIELIFTFSKKKCIDWFYRSYTRSCVACEWIVSILWNRFYKTMWMECIRTNSSIAIQFEFTDVRVPTVGVDI